MNDELIKEFSYIGECAEYLINIGAVNSNNVNYIRDKISLAIKTNKPYKNYKFK